MANDFQKSAVHRLYLELKREHGAPDEQWSFWCRRPKSAAEQERVIVEAILTQRAAWRNVQQAWANLAAAGAGRLAVIARTAREPLEALVRPAGFYRQKARRLRALAGFFNARGGPAALGTLPLHRLRTDLLAIEGVGPETADDILLYALEKPVFVVDEYTRRLARRRQLATGFSYRRLQETFQAGLPEDWRLYQDFHALIVTAEKNRRAGRGRQAGPPGGWT